jgi:hypothetical protein
MTKITVPKFENYEEEAAYWDNLDTADFMEDDGQWFQFEVPLKRAMQVAILPEIANQLAERARLQGVSIETLVNTSLIEYLHKRV